MTKHIYLYSSNLNITRDLREDDNFQPVPEYNDFDINKAFQNEWGRIVSGNNYYHILLGKIKQNGCPWCGSEGMIKKIGVSDFFQMSNYCIQCIKCGARGPILNVAESIESDEVYMKEIEALLTRRFHNRLPWDHGFANPYEEQKKDPLP